MKTSDTDKLNAAFDRAMSALNNFRTLSIKLGCPLKSVSYSAGQGRRPSHLIVRYMKATKP